jgi:hypothetical protein
MCPVVQDDLVLISAAYYRAGAVLLRVKPTANRSRRSGASRGTRWSATP